jgi:hypothetical protein
MGWDGVRILQDNCIWIYSRDEVVGMHQDGSYLDYVDPPEMVPAGSRSTTRRPRLGRSRSPRVDTLPRQAGEHAASSTRRDWLEPARRSAPDGEELRLEPVVVKAGGASFHTTTSLSRLRPELRGDRPPAP